MRLAKKRFVSLVREIDDARPARHLPPEESDRTKGCWRENPDQPLHKLVQEAVFKYDLSPKDSEFLIRFYRKDQ